MDEEVERCYEEFYEDVHTEFLKFGEIVNFKVCRNGSFHLRGNVYIHYKSLESAVLAYHAVNGRYFAGKQVNCEFVSVTKWRIAICGEYLKSRLKTCSRGTACNFLHCFGNPGGDYEWADWDRPPPRYWVKKMTALFGHSDEYWYDRDQQMEQESSRERRNFSRILAADRDRYHSRRSRSREADKNGSYARSLHEEHDYRKSTHQKQHTPDGRKRLRSVDQKNYEEERKYGNNQHGKNLSSESDTDGGRSVRDTDWDGYHDSRKRRSGHENKRTESRDHCVASRSRTHERGSGEDLSISDRDIDKYHNGSRKRSSHRKEVPDLSDDHAESEHSKLEEERVGKRSRSSRRGRSSSVASKVSSPEELIKSSGHHDTNSSSRSRLRIKSNNRDSRYDYNEDVDKVGHRESDIELLSDKHKRSKRKSTIDGTVESNSAHQYHERHKSQDTEYYHHDEDNDKRDRWKPDESPPEKDHKSRRLLRDDRERHRQSTGSRSRGSRWSSRERRSDSLEGVDSAEELQKQEENNRRSREKHRSHGHSHKGEQKKSISEKQT